MPAQRLRIPLAWLQLSWDRLRLCAALAGIVFAVALMLIQLGFSDALYRVAVEFHRQMRGDLVMLSTQYEYLNATAGFSERYLQQAKAFPEVESVAPIYVGMANFKSRETHRDLPIFAIGFNPQDAAFAMEAVNAQRDLLKIPDVVLFDEGSKPAYGNFRGEWPQGTRMVTELSGHRVEIGGKFFLGISFASDGNLMMSDRTFFRVMPGSQAAIVNIGSITLKSGTDAESFRQKILPTLPPGIQVMTREQYIAYEQDYWAKRTPIGFIFNMGTFVGFLVGAVIVYQILYTDVTDHLGEYATLKAMGYNDRFLSKVVIEEGLILAVLGFIPGWLFSVGMGVLTRKVTLLPVHMTWERTTIVLSLTMLMCTASGLLAMKKLRSADPAENF